MAVGRRHRRSRCTRRDRWIRPARRPADAAQRERYSRPFPPQSLGYPPSHRPLHRVETPRPAPPLEPQPAAMPRIPIIMPQLGESIAEATVLNIAFKAGDTVETDQDVLEVETNKATMGVT